MKKTLFVNLFASPGSGKSTTAAAVFSKLKLKGYDCELITEFAKDLVWEERFKTLSNQLYVSGKQGKKVSTLNGKVDIAITDSPILLSAYYNSVNKRYNIENFNNLMLEEFNKYNNLNFFIRFNKSDYNPNGRMQTSEESFRISYEIKAMMDKFELKYNYVDKNEESIDYIVDYIINKLGE